MLFVPDFLYGLTLKDQAGLTLSYNHFHRLLTLAQDQIDVLTDPVPLDRIWVLTWQSYRAEGGGAQTIVSVRMTEVDENTNDVGLIRSDTVPADLVELFIATQYVVRPGNRIRVNTFFSAGALTNEVQISLSGFQIPRGNVQLVG